MLGGKNFCQLKDHQKIDLSPTLIDKYSDQYIDHPRFPKLLERNSISTKDILSGEDEADAFDKGEYSKIHPSTLSKVDRIGDILCLATENKFQTAIFWLKMIWKIYGFTPQGLFEFGKDDWRGYVILTTLLGVLGGVIATFVCNLFFN